jgi:hypothetical protein
LVDLVLKEVIAVVEDQVGVVIRNQKLPTQSGTRRDRTGL